MTVAVIVAALAAIGASTAMAKSTALCSVDQDPCLESHRVTSIDFLDPAVELLASTGNIKCEVLVSGEVLAAGAPQVIHGKLTYSNCKMGETSCEVKELSSGGLLSVLETAEELAEVTGSAFQVLFKCNLFIHCVYNMEGLNGHLLGALKATSGHITFTKQSLTKVSGLFCPSKANLDALFESLGAVYLASKYEADPASSTALCTVDSSPCFAGNLVRSVHFVDPAIELLTTLGNVKCEALILGEALALGYPQAIHINLTYSKCKSGETSCEVKEITPFGSLDITKTATELAEVTGLKFEVLVECKGLIHCVYGTSGLVGHLTGALTATKGHITFSKAPLKAITGSLCPSMTDLDALFESLVAVFVSS